MIRPGAVILLALVATLLTRPALAEPEPSAAEATAQTGLPVRPTKAPLVLEPAPSSGGTGYKLALVALVGLAGVWAWRQRAKKAPTEATGTQLRVLTRTTVGVRSELLVLELDGQRLLVGVTPSSMQTLYLFPDVAQEEPVVVDTRERRIANLLESRIAQRPAPSEPARTPAPPVVEDDASLEGQAAGLRALGARR
jgi:MYXO-CTERM domain-containing protein